MGGIFFMSSIKARVLSKKARGSTRPFTSTKSSVGRMREELQSQTRERAIRGVLRLLIRAEDAARDAIELDGARGRTLTLVETRGIDAGRRVHRRRRGRARGDQRLEHGECGRVVPLCEEE